MIIKDVNRLSDYTFSKCDILIPNCEDMQKWSVVACDQYTSEPEYWENVGSIVGQAPSSLRVTLPEIYLEQDGVDERIEKIYSAMREYTESGLLATVADSMVYLERTLADGRIRRGIIGTVDLEKYDYSIGSQSRIRATEGTVLSRIPPRARVRRGAVIELPHIMLLVDDAEREVIEPLGERKGEFEKLYDFDLMCGGGHVTGYRIAGAEAGRISSALEKFASPEYFESKYGVSGKGPLQFAVGDGNHSLATAKRCYEELKQTMTEEEWSVHPSRYALVELVNLHDGALEFEAIHRVVFDVDPDRLIADLRKYYDVSDTECGGQSFEYITMSQRARLYIKNPSSNLTVGTLQNFIDSYLEKNGGRVDYIHGVGVVESLASKPGNIGFILPDMSKSELFPTVILDGALPRKTFSMGHACDKRFYLEARKIK